MPRYRMKCSHCGLIQFVLGSMDDPPKVGICDSCSSETYRWFDKARVQVQVFEPYVEDSITGDPIPITSRKERDQVLESQGVTYDRVSRVKRERKPLLTEDDYDTIIEEAHKLSHEEVKASLRKSRPVAPISEGEVISMDFNDD